jgi:hypothetical protein
VELDDTFREIARSIIVGGKTEDEWSEIESDDMFQSGAYSGGFDATERAFTFSFYGPDGEYWFQLTLDEMRDVADGIRSAVEARPAG